MNLISSKIATKMMNKYVLYLIRMIISNISLGYRVDIYLNGTGRLSHFAYNLCDKTMSILRTHDDSLKYIILDVIKHDHLNRTETVISRHNLINDNCAVKPYYQNNNSINYDTLTIIINKIIMTSYLKLFPEINNLISHQLSLLYLSP